MNETKNKTEDNSTEDQATASSDLPVQILAQYVQDLSFENPNAINVLKNQKEPPEMNINIGMDARKIPDDKDPNLYEVILSIRAEATAKEGVVFIAEMQYGVAVSVGKEVPEENHHPLLLIEIPRMAFPFARQILANTTINGGFPPLLLTPVDFQALYMKRFDSEIQEAREQFEKELDSSIDKSIDEELKKEAEEATKN